MSAEHERLKEILAEAAGIDTPEARAVFLDAACRGDVALRQQVEALLSAHARAGDFLEKTVELPPANFAIERTGAMIGRYKLLEKIGEGGFGTVFMAEQTTPVHRKVALKIIKAGMDTREVTARFEAERQALALMDHPNIARVLDAGTTETSRPYFVMELVRGIPITDYCDQKELPTVERLRLFMKVCAAVQHAHQKGIIHRDLKPTNILVTVIDGEPAPKVIDFGVAKALGQKLTEKTLFTGFQQMIGTPAYMSPEQAELSGVDVDTRSDIYSLGVLLYELLTGVTPFDADTLRKAALDEIRRLIRETEPAKPSTRLRALGSKLTEVAQRRHTEPAALTRQVHGDLDWIAMKCLEKERARRYETANGLADDVLRHLRNEPVVAGPPSKFYRFNKLVQRNKALCAAGAIVTVALLVGLGFSLWTLSKERVARQRALAAEQAAKAEAGKSQQVAQFLKDMLQGVGPSVAMGRDTTMLREILDRTAERVGKDLKDQPEIEVELRNIIGQVYCELGQGGKAESMHEGALALARRLHGEQHPAVAASLHELATALSSQGRLPEAEAAERAALAIRKGVPGGGHCDVARSLQQLAKILNEQNRLTEAETMAREALAIFKQLEVEQSGDWPAALANLGMLVQRQGRPAEAEALYREALARQKELLGNDHPDRANTLVDFSMVLYSRGKLAEAESFCREAVVLLRKLYGDEHRDVVASLRCLAAMLCDQDKLADAEALLRTGLATLRKGPGNNDVMLAGLLVELTESLRRQGKVDEAEPLSREALELTRKLQTKGVQARSLVHLAWFLERLASVLREQGCLAESETFLHEAVTIQMSLPVCNPDDLPGSLVALASLLREEQKLEEAEDSYRKALALWKGKPVSGNLANALASFADMLRDQGRLAEAESFYREAVTNSEGAWPDQFKNWEWQFNNLVDVIERQGKTNEIEQLRNESLPGFAGNQPSKTTVTNQTTARQPAP